MQMPIDLPLSHPPVLSDLFHGRFVVQSLLQIVLHMFLNGHILPCRNVLPALLFQALALQYQHILAGAPFFTTGITGLEQRFNDTLSGVLKLLS